METEETKSKLAAGIRDLQAKGDTNGINSLVSAYKSKYRPVQQADHGFLGNVAAGVLKLPAKAATNVIQAGEIATGNKVTKPFSGSFLGDVGPIGEGFDSAKGITPENVKALKDSAGSALEAASYMVGAPEVKAGFETLKAGNLFAKPTLKAVYQSGKAAFAPSALNSAGTSLQDKNKGLAENAYDTVTGTLLGTAAGAGLGLAAKVLPKIPLITKAGREAATAKESDYLFQGLQNKTPEVIDQMAKKEQGFSDSMNKLFEESTAIRPKNVITRAQSKVENLAKNSDGAIDEDVFKNIYKNGSIDGIGSEGKIVNTKAIERSDARRIANAQLLQEHLASSPHIIDSGEIATDFANTVKGKYKNNADKNLVDNIINEYDVFKNGTKVHPADLYEISKDLGERAYKSDQVFGDGKIVESTKADIYRGLQKKINDYLKNEVPSKNSGTIKKLFDNQTLEYATRSALKAMENIKLKSGAGKSGAGILGSILGYSTAGPAGAMIGNFVSKQAYEKALNAFSNKNLASKVMEKFAQVANEAELKGLSKLVSEDTGGNYREKSIKDYIQKVANKKAGVIKAKQLSPKNNQGNNYSAKLPTIDFGKPAPKKKLNEYLPTIR